MSAGKLPVAVSRTVLAIDPGTTRMGWGVIAISGVHKTALGAGVIAMSARDPLPKRLHQVYRALEELHRKYSPTEFAVEDVFYAKFANAAIKLGHVRGVILLSAEAHDARVFEYPPATVKRAIAGNGAAEKVQVARMVAVHLGLKKMPPVDATDALAIGLTHAIRGGLGSR